MDNIIIFMTRVNTAAKYAHKLMIKEEDQEEEDQEDYCALV
jgi:hypothetical protein